MLWYPSNLHHLRILVLKRSFPLKVRVISFLYVFEDLPVFLILVRQFPAQKALKQLIQLQIIDNADIPEPFDLLSPCLDPPVPIMHH